MVDLYVPKVGQIPEVDESGNPPAATPALFNKHFANTQDAFDALEPIAQDVKAAAGDGSLADRLNNLAGLVDNLSASDANSVAQALWYSWMFSGFKFALDLFVPNFTLQDDLSGVNVLEGIAGDDSIDVDDPNAILKVGRDYILSDGVNSEQVTVTALLEDDRIRVSSALIHAYASGTLRRSSWIINTAHALAGNGQTYFAGPFSNFGERSKTLIIRRSDNDCILRCFYRLDTEDSWREAMNDPENSGQPIDGLTNQAWTINTDKIFSIQIISTHGEDREDAKVEHLAIIEDSKASGVPILSVRNPLHIKEGETFSFFVSNLNDYEWETTRLDLRVMDQVGTDVTNQFNLSINTDNMSGTATAPLVDQAKAYKIQARSCEHGLTRSVWSKGVNIQVGDVPVNQPQIITIGGEDATSGTVENVGETPTITFSDYSADGDYPCTERRLILATDPYLKNPIHTAILAADALSYNMPAGNITAGSVFYLGLEDESTDGLISPVSKVIRVFSSASFVIVEAPNILSPLDGATDIGNEVAVDLESFVTNGAGNHSGTKIRLIRASDSVEVYNSGWLEATLNPTIPSGIHEVSTEYILAVSLKDDSDPPVESSETEIRYSTAETFHDADRWAEWDESSEEFLASPSMLVMRMENPTAGGNELATGGDTLSDTDRTFYQFGNIPGAVDGRRSLSLGQAFMPSSVNLDSFIQSARAFVFKCNSSKSDGYYTLFTTGTAHYATDGVQLYVHGGDAKLQVLAPGTANGFVSADSLPSNVDIWIYMEIDHDTKTIKAGWHVSKVTHWSDIPVGQRGVVTASSLPYNGLVLGRTSPTVTNLYPFEGEIIYFVAASEPLLEA